MRRSSEVAMMDTGFKDILRLAIPQKIQSPTWRERLKQRWDEGVRHKVTPLGAMMVVLLLVSGLLAFATSQNVFFLLFSLLMASILISSFVNRLMLSGLKMKLDVAEHSMAGESLKGSLIIDNRKRWLASFALEVVAPLGRRFYVPCVEGGKSVTVCVDVVWLKRGLPEPLIVELATRFPFGFSMRRTRVAVRVNRSIYPSIREKPGFASVFREIEGRAAGLASASEAEFSHLREYVAGDDWRRIAWGKSARGDSWIVKEVKAGGEGRLRLWLDRGSGDFELLVELAAYVVWELQFSNTKFTFATDHGEIEVSDRREAYIILRLLADLAAGASEIPNHDSNVYILSFRPGFIPRPGEISADPHERHGL